MLKQVVGCYNTQGWDSGQEHINPGKLDLLCEELLKKLARGAILGQ